MESKDNVKARLSPARHVRREPSSAVMATDRRVAVSARTQPLTVLVVDGRTQDALCAVLKRMGHECRGALDVAGALSSYAIARSDVVICGPSLPREEALRLCRQIRAQARPRYTYVIVVGATGRDAVEAARAGADACLERDFDAELLEARLVVAARICRDYTGLVARNAELRRDSQTFLRAARMDALTGIPNRRRLEEDIESLESQVARYGRQVTFAMCDVDDFKGFNDCFGHLAGDSVLRRIAQAARDSLRRGDQVYRYGGEEFLVVLPEQGRTQALAAMERLRVAIEALAVSQAPGSRHPVVTISIGIGSVAVREGSVRHAIAAADRALYRAKATGGNTLAFEWPGGPESPTTENRGPA